jgi:hypothetical protein
MAATLSKNRHFTDWLRRESARFLMSTTAVYLNFFAGNAEKTTAEVQVLQDLQKPGQPSLGMLALGADAFPLWRREETLPSR